MTLKDITINDIGAVTRIWQREDPRGARSVIMMTDDPETIEEFYNSTTVTVMRRDHTDYGRAAVRRMLQMLFEDYPYIAYIAKEILTPKDEDNDTAGTV